MYANKYSDQAWGTASIVNSDATSSYIYSNGAGFSAICRQLDSSGIDNISAKLNF